MPRKTALSVALDAMPHAASMRPRPDAAENQILDATAEWTSPELQ